MIDEPANFTPLPPDIQAYLKTKTPDSPLIIKKVTPEDAAQYKGRPPKAIADQVAAIRREVETVKREKERLEAAERNKIGLARRTKNNRIALAKKLDRFLEEFLKNGGNATQAALTTGNYSSVHSANVAGSYYLKKARGLARVYMERKGYGYGKLLDIAAQKLKSSKTPEWWDRLMKLTEYHDFMAKDKTSPAVVNVIQSHKDLVSSYIEGGEIEDVEEIEPVEEKNE